MEEKLRYEAHFEHLDIRAALKISRTLSQTSIIKRQHSQPCSVEVGSISNFNHQAFNFFFLVFLPCMA